MIINNIIDDFQSLNIVSFSFISNALSELLTLSIPTSSFSQKQKKPPLSQWFLWFERGIGYRDKLT
jgi:hypothetical protein